VASDIPGVRDVVEPGVNGYVSPLRDEGTFAEKLRELLQSDETLLAMRRASARKAREFELSGIVDQYEAVLKRAASPAP
jgi:glycosyltransferase involved in cell wall biosynthesis